MPCLLAHDQGHADDHKNHPHNRRWIQLFAENDVRIPLRPLVVRDKTGSRRASRRRMSHISRLTAPTDRPGTS